MKYLFAALLCCFVRPQAVEILKNFNLSNTLLTSTIKAFFFTLLFTFCLSCTPTQAPKEQSEPALQPRKTKLLTRKQQDPVGEPIAQLLVSDLNNDGFPELLLSATSGAVYLYPNTRNLTFGASRKLFTTDCPINLADLDRDGYLDLFSLSAWYKNQRDFSFLPTTLEGIETKEKACPKVVFFQDVNQDGQLDLCTESAVWENQNLSFSKLKSTKAPQLSDTLRADLRLSGEQEIVLFQEEKVILPESWEVASAFVQLVLADLDRDGDTELIGITRDQQLEIWENQREQVTENHYLKVRLIGSSAGNYYSIGAQLTLEQGGSTQYFRNTPYWKGGTQEPVLYLGLGATGQADAIQIRWADGKTQRLEDIRSNQELSLSQQHAQ